MSTLKTFEDAVALRIACERAEAERDAYRHAFEEMLKSFPSSLGSDGPEGDDRNRTGGGVRS